MARVHYWQYIVDEEGRPIQGVDVDFFLNEDIDSTQYADIYVNPTVGSTTTTDAVDLKTNIDGYFEFWVGDEWELEGGYASTQRFKLTWYKAGISRGTIENIDIYPPLYQIDETLAGQTPVSEAERRNKVISNALAFRWDAHVNSVVPSASPHNILPVIICDTDTEYNKVVSNVLMNKIYTLAVSGSTITLDADSADIWHGTYTFTADVAKILIHNLDDDYPIVQVVDDSDNTLVIPATVESIDSDTVEVTMGVGMTGNVTIIG